MPFDLMKVPENIVEAAADNSNAKHIYRAYLKSRNLETWMDMCDDARNEIPPQQFYFRYLMRDTGSGTRHPNDNLSPDTSLADLGFGDVEHLQMGFNANRPKKKVTKNWTLNVSHAFFERVGASVMANDWSVATWRNYYRGCENEALTYEELNHFFEDFTKSHHYPKFVEAKLLSIYERNKAGVHMELGLNMRRHAGILSHQFFPLALKYAMVSAYLISKGHAHGQGMKRFAEGYFNKVNAMGNMPMTYAQFFDALADY
ncbi:MAG: hypothetical protein AAF601_05275 [Pseudomonadota bacterium]